MRRVRLSALLAIVLTALAAGPAVASEQQPPTRAAEYSAAARLPTMSPSDAQRLARQTLAARFESWRWGYGKRIRCATRISRTERRCKVSWGIGDAGYRGTVTPFYSHRGDPWYARYRIRMLDEYCFMVLDRSRSRCTTHYRGTY